MAVMGVSADLDNNWIISGTGIKYRFDRELYLNAVKYVMETFDKPMSSAKSLIDYYIVTGYRFGNTKKATNIRLKNIVQCGYDWHEFFNQN